MKFCDSPRHFSMRAPDWIPATICSKSTPLGWACRWGRAGLVQLFLECGADPLEADAEPWAALRAWPEKMGHDAALAVL